MVRRKISRPVGILTAALLIATSGPLNANANEPAEVPVQFADKELQACVQKVVPSLLPSKVAELTELSCEYDGEQPHMIHDFYGFEMLTNVEKVTFANFNFVHPAEDTEPEVEAAAMLPIWEKLEVLTIDKSEQLPMWVSGLSELKDLNLTNGKFAVLPEFFELPKLERIDLTGSNIPASAVFTEDTVEVIGAATEPESEEEADEAESKDAEEEVVEEEQAPADAVAEAEAQERSSRSAQEEPQAVTRGGEPKDTDVLPDGHLKLKLYPDKNVTYAETKEVTKLVIRYSTNLPQDENGNYVFSDFTGYEFFPNVTELAFVNGFVVKLPEGKTLGDLFPKLQKLEFTSIKGETVPDFSSSTLQEVKFISNYDYKVLPKFDVPELTKLTLNEEARGQLSEFNFSGMPKLQELNLTGSRLQSTSSLKSSTVKTLIINGTNFMNNRFAALDLSGLTNIKVVEVKGQTILRSLNGLSSSTLEELTLERVPLEVWSSDIRLPALRELTIKNSSLRSFQASLPNLTVLNLARNKDLAELPRDSILPELESLDASQCKISQVQPMHMPKLKTLKLNKNVISEVSDELVLNSLETLDISDNILTSLDGISLPKLKELFASNTSWKPDNQRISSVSFANLPMLENAQFREQAISNFDSLASPTLKTLDITQNKVANIGADVQMPLLEELYAQQNPLESLTITDLNMPRIKKAEFGFTQIDSLVGIRSKSLEELSLIYSQISSLEGITDLPNIKKLNLSNNLILDARGIEDIPQGTDAYLSSQKLSFGDVAVGKSVNIKDYYQLPTGYSMDWTQSYPSDVVTVNPVSEQFMVLKSESWNFTGYMKGDEHVQYSISASGVGVGEGITGFGLKELEPVSVGDTVTVKVDLPASWSSQDVEYSWYRKLNYRATANTSKPEGFLEDESSDNLTLKVDQQHDLWVVKAKVVYEGFELWTNEIEVKVKPTFVDTNFEKCIADTIGKSVFRYKDVWEIARLDCSGRGISSTADFYMLNPSNINGWRSYNFSNNNIVEIESWVDNLNEYLPNTYSTRTYKASYRLADGGLYRYDSYFSDSAKWDFSNNQISNISALMRLPLDWITNTKDLNYAGREQGFVFDGNQIVDLSGLERAAYSLGRGSLGEQRHVLHIKNQAVGSLSSVQIPAVVEVPKVLDANGERIPIYLNGNLVETDNVRLTEIPEPNGLYTFSWDPGWAWGTVFNGRYDIRVVDDVRFGIQPSEQKAGHEVIATVSGLQPNEQIEFAWDDGESIGTGKANLAGIYHLPIVLPHNKLGSRIITATSESGVIKSASVKVLEDDVVDFPDIKLRECVTAQLDKGLSDKIYQAEVDAAFSIHFACDGRGVKDLTGLDAIHAETISLQNNEISSLDTLPTLYLRGDETSISLQGNKIKDLGTVNPQPSLKSISLRANQISDFSPLAVLNNVNIAAMGQKIQAPNGIKDIPYTLPTITGIADDDVDIIPTDSDVQILDNGQVKWPKAIRFQFIFRANHDANPKLQAGGSFTVNVVEPGRLEINAAPSQLYAGQMINIIASGFHPGENVTITLHSRVITIGTYKADERGVVEVKEYVVPKTMTPGEHTLSAVGETSKRQTNTKIKILASSGGNDKPVNPPVNPPKPGGDHQPVQPQPSLPGIRPVQPASGATDRGQQVDRADRANENRAQRRGGPTPRSGAGSPAALVFLLAAGGCAIGLRRSLRKAN